MMRHSTGRLPACATALLIAAWSHLASCAGIEGRWMTFDDDTRQPRAIVAITDNAGVITGRVVALMQEPGNGLDAVCEACRDADAGKPILGLTILRLARDHDRVEGTVLDPDDGSTYRCIATLSNDGETLELRAFITIPAFGQTVIWRRAR